MNTLFFINNLKRRLECCTYQTTELELKLSQFPIAINFESIQIDSKSRYFIREVQYFKRIYFRTVSDLNSQFFPLTNPLFYRFESRLSICSCLDFLNEKKLPVNRLKLIENLGLNIILVLFFWVWRGKKLSNNQIIIVHWTIWWYFWRSFGW